MLLAVTHETPFYGALNASLRSKNRSDVKAFFPWMKLMLNGLYKLPLGDGSGTLQSVFRGVHGLLKREMKGDVYFHRVQTRFPVDICPAFSNFVYRHAHMDVCLYTFCGTFFSQLYTTFLHYLPTIEHNLHISGSQEAVPKGQEICQRMLDICAHRIFFLLAKQ